MAGAKLIFTSDTLTPTLIKAPITLRAALWAFTQYQSGKVQDHMRNTAPWTDRTGNARGGLFANPRKGASNEFAIVMYHTVPYGIWLEVRHSGQYAVIVPSLQSEGPRVMRELSKLMGTMSRAVV